MTTALLLAILSAGPGVAAQNSPYTLPRESPRALRLRAKRVPGTRRYRVRATVVLKAGQDRVGCEGGRFVAKATPGGTLRTTFDAKCHADFKVKVPRGLHPRKVRLRGTFKGTETLRPKRSKTIRLA